MKYGFLPERSRVKRTAATDGRITVNPNRVDSVVDLVYGLLIALSVGLILVVGTETGVAFGFGVLVSFVVHIAWKMARFDPEWMTSVQETVDAAVSQTVDETVSDAVDESVEEAVGEAVGESVEETVEQSLEEAVDESIEETVSETVEEAVEETVGETVDESLEQAVEEQFGDASDTAAEDAESGSHDR